MVARHLTFAPLQPSNLSFVSGPSSPASPLSPFGLRPRPLWTHKRSRTQSSSDTASSDGCPPVKPDPWTWKCHQCHSRFPLGATRRCLHDGHHLCSGTTEVSRRSGRVKHTKSCSSEFDYAGWRAFSKWKRRFNCHKGAGYDDGTDQCIYPSECRWNPEARAQRMREDLEATAPDTREVRQTPTFDDILGSPVYGTTTDLPEPTVSFTPRGVHPSSSSCAATSTTLSSASSDHTSEHAVPEPVSDIVERQIHTRTSSDRSGKSFEKRNAKMATLLSPIQEEEHSNPTSPAVVKISRPLLNFSSYFEKFLKSGSSAQQPAQEMVEIDDKVSAKAVTDHDWYGNSLHSAMDIDRYAHDLTREAEDMDTKLTNGDLDNDVASGNALFDFHFDQDEKSLVSPSRSALDCNEQVTQIGNIGEELCDKLDMDFAVTLLEYMDRNRETR